MENEKGIHLLLFYQSLLCSNWSKHSLPLKYDDYCLEVNTRMFALANNVDLVLCAVPAI